MRPFAAPTSTFIRAHSSCSGPTISLTVMIAGGVALGFVVPAYGVNYLFAGRKLALFLIDAGYWVVTYLVMGVAIELLA